MVQKYNCLTGAATHVISLKISYFFMLSMPRMFDYITQTLLAHFLHFWAVSAFCKQCFVYFGLWLSFIIIHFLLFLWRVLLFLGKVSIFDNYFCRLAVWSKKFPLLKSLCDLRNFLRFSLLLMVGLGPTKIESNLSITVNDWL